MTKQEHINYWLEQAEDSWQSALVLMEGKKYAMAAFCFHLSIEKLLKGIWVKNNVDNYPPKIHNLVYLHDASKLDLEETFTDMFKFINTWNMEGRYPEYLNKLHYAITKEYLGEKLSSLETLKQCLQKILQ